MSRPARLVLVALALAVGLFVFRYQSHAADAELGSVIFFHPDGMGVNTWGAVRVMTVGPDGRLNWDKLPYMAVYTGHMKDRLTSTSHGGATTHAYGVKVLADSYGMDGKEPLTAASGFPGSILQEAQAAGLAVGMVNSGTSTEPGSGVFGASHPTRYEHEAISLKIFETGADVILGGGEQYFLPKGAEGVYGPGAREDGRDLIAEARERGYTVVRTREELLSLPDTATKVLGLFAFYHTFNDQPEERLREEGLEAWPPEAPTIAEMTRVALDVLSLNGRRFFLVAEEEGTDNMANANNAMGEIVAGQRADEAIGVIRSFIADAPEHAHGHDVGQRRGRHAGVRRALPFGHGTGLRRERCPDGRRGGHERQAVPGAARCQRCPALLRDHVGAVPRRERRDPDEGGGPGSGPGARHHGQHGCLPGDVFRAARSASGLGQCIGVVPRRYLGSTGASRM